MILIVCGSEGVGKTTVAQMITEKLKDAALIRTDIIRKDLFKNPAHSNEEDQQVYDEMFSRAEKLLSKNIILDATFRKNSNRLKAKELALLKRTGFMIIYVTCSKEIAEKRIKGRKYRYSDFHPDLNIKYHKGFDALEKDYIVIENDSTLEELHKKVENWFLTNI
jgi:predicted kinase